MNFSDDIFRLSGYCNGINRAARYVFNGVLDVGVRCSLFQWLFENRKEGCSSSALAMAAGRGHLEVVKWFYEKNVRGDISKAIDQANEEGHVEVGSIRVVFFLCCSVRLFEARQPEAVWKTDHQRASHNCCCAVWKRTRTGRCSLACFVSFDFRQRKVITP